MAASDVEWAARLSVAQERNQEVRELRDECTRLRARVKALQEERDSRLDVMRAALVKLARLVIDPTAKGARRAFAREVIAEHGEDGS